MENQRLLERKQSFKKGISKDEGRRRREETTLQIRKSKKEEQIAKRRAGSGTTNNVTAVNTTTTNTMAPDANKSPVRPASDIPSIAQTILNPSSTLPNILMAVREVRRMLSVDDGTAPIRPVIDSGILPRLTQFLWDETNHELQFESAWALTNVASSQYTPEVALAIQALVQCLVSNSAQVREQAIWCLGNIAGHCTELRDQVLRHQVMRPLLLNIQKPELETLLGNATWALSNLMRGKPQPELELVTPALDVLVAMLHNESLSDEILVDVCWCLSYMSDGDNDRIQAVLETNVARRLVELLRNKDASAILTPAVRCLGNFASGNTEQTQAVINAGILDCTRKLLKHRQRSLSKEIIWVLSNIAAGTQDQINKLYMKNACLMDIVHRAKTAPWEIRKEALWVLSNIFTGGTDSHVELLAHLDGLEAICAALLVNDSGVVMCCLEAVEKVLAIGERTGEDYKRDIEEYDGVENMEKLQEHASDAVYNKVISIIDTFYGREEDEDENTAPAIDGDKFAFGMPSVQLFADNKSPNQEGEQPFQQQFNFGGPIHQV